jgi:deazaflavin-dependent oxidoreductase (nitroreductase family)
MAGGSVAASEDQHGSRLWSAIFWMLFRGAPRSLMERIRRSMPAAPMEEVLVVGRKSGTERSYLLTLIDVDSRWAIGHPNGRSQWVRNLEAAGRAVVVHRDGSRTEAAATLLPDGPERDAAIAFVGRQPFPAGPIYRHGRKHVTAVGCYFRLVPIAGPTES